MKNILIHGLGQNNESWNKTKKYLSENKIDVECPNLFEIDTQNEMSYVNLYKSFSNYCNKQKEKLNLCGLSLGGILALEYAKEYPDKVNSIVLVGTPYKIPKILFKAQNIIFKFMPKKSFQKIGISKKKFCCLVNSMCNIEISKNLDTILCKSLILCGIKDNINMDSAKLLNANIKGSKLLLIDDSSHEVNIDNPKELANIICDFWK
ncbi:MAG: alpha/beta hydrolase [Ruminococcus sp.]|nr:alpha/beta hydrolase [Ruminococcus sp.]